MNRCIDWNLALGVFLGTLPMLSVMLWFLIKPKHARKENK